MSFKDELLKAKENHCPEELQELIDNGIVQECEFINSVYYISFAFQMKHTSMYNYNPFEGYNPSFFYFEHADLIYCGGMAIDKDLNVIKGIIYPYYLSADNDCNLIFDDNTINEPFVLGTPQIIVKSYKTKLTDWFEDGDCMHVFNIVTNDSNAWCDFIKGKESYYGTWAHMNDDNTVHPNDTYDDHTWFGKLDNYKEKGVSEIFRYTGEYVTSRDALPMGYIERALKQKNIEKNIASKIYCNAK